MRESQLGPSTPAPILPTRADAQARACLLGALESCATVLCEAGEHYQAARALYSAARWGGAGAHSLECRVHRSAGECNCGVAEARRAEIPEPTSLTVSTTRLCVARIEKEAQRAEKFADSPGLISIASSRALGEADGLRRAARMLRDKDNR